MYKHVNILNTSRKVTYVFYQSVLSTCIVKATKAVFWKKPVWQNIAKFRGGQLYRNLRFHRVANSGTGVFANFEKFFKTVFCKSLNGYF